MRTTTYSLFTLLLTFLCVSCFETEFEVYESSNLENQFFNVDKNNLFIGDEANLVINSGDYSEIQVIPFDTIQFVTDSLSIIQIDNSNYKITSTATGVQTIQGTAKDANGEDVVGYRKIEFHEHGTTDFTTVEGVVLLSDYKRKLTALHGEPEAIEAIEVIRILEQVEVENEEGELVTALQLSRNNSERWYYFSKGFHFDVYSNETSVLTPLQEAVYSITVYSDDWSKTIDGVTYNGEIYPYEYVNDDGLILSKIDDLSPFTTTEGLLIEDVIEKYGESDSDIDGTYVDGDVEFNFDIVTRKVTSISVNRGFNSITEAFSSI